MPLNFPNSRKEVIDRIKTDVQAELPQSNPFLRNSFLSSLMVGYGGRVFEVYIQLLQLLKELFLDTASGDFLARWGYYINVIRNVATQSSGAIAVTGIVGSLIPAGTEFQSVSGNTYTSQIDETIQSALIDISTLTFLSGTATATTVGEHDFGSGMLVTISGADQPEYNGTFPIFATNSNVFTYEVSGNPITPATGTIKASADLASVELLSVDTGVVQNLDNGAILNVTTPLAGVDSISYVEFSGILGGTDVESDDNFRQRILEKYQNPNTPFNVANIIDVAKEVSGVTRVFVEEPTTTTGTYVVTSLTQTNNIAVCVTAVPHSLISGMYISITGAVQLDYNVFSAPVLVIDANTFIYLVQNNPTSPATGTIHTSFAAVQPGQTRVFFTRDNDENIIPTPSEVDDVKNKLLTIKPAHMSVVDLIVLAPISVPLTFNFASITPDTPSMRRAIHATLEAFFRESTVVGETLLQKAYNAAIFDTIDTETGETLQNFSLNLPTGDITILSGQLATFQGDNL